MNNSVRKPSPAVIITGAIIVIALVSICLYGAYSVFARDEPVVVDPLDGVQLGNSSEYAEVVNALYKICHEQPEVLAATISAFPKQLQRNGVTVSDPKAAPMNLDEMMNGENGGDVQLLLLVLLHNILEDPQTKFAFAEWSGPANILCMAKHDPDGPDSMENFYLYWEETNLEDAKVLGIVTGEDSRDHEFAYFDLAGGFQRFVPSLS